MLSQLILGLLGLAIYWNISKTSQHMEEYKKKYNSQTATCIKYDKRELKRYTIGVVSSSVVFAASVVLLNINIDFLTERRLNEALMKVTLWGLLLGGALCIIFVYHLLSGIFYFKRLKRYGYEVPEDKRKYAGVLERLPRNDVQIQGYGKTSRCLKWTCILVCLVMCVFSFYYLYKWNFMGEDTKALFVLQLIADAFWIVPILVFHNQMNPLKFKNDVEIDANRKDRMNVVSGVLLIVVLVAVSALLKNTAHNMSAYVFGNWMSKDLQRIATIQQAFQISYIDPWVVDCDERLEETKRSLEAGVDITNWGIPEGEFQEKIAACLEITDFSALKSEFRSVDGLAIVYVKLEDGNFSVQLMNLHPVAEREIKVE